MERKLLIITQTAENQCSINFSHFARISAYGLIVSKEDSFEAGAFLILSRKSRVLWLNAICEFRLL
jgi:hypothetical protein